MMTMQSKLHELCNDCVTSLQSPLQDQPKTLAPVGFDWITIMTLLIPLLTEWLQGSCLAKRSASDLEGLMAKGDIWSKVCMNHGARQLRLQHDITLGKEHKEAILLTLKNKAKDGKLEPALQEVKDVFSVTDIW